MKNGFCLINRLITKISKTFLVLNFETLYKFFFLNGQNNYFQHQKIKILYCFSPPSLFIDKHLMCCQYQVNYWLKSEYRGNNIMKVKTYLFRFAVAFTAFIFGISFLYVGQYFQSVFSPQGQKISEIVKIDNRTFPQHIIEQLHTLLLKTLLLLIPKKIPKTSLMLQAIISISVIKK